MSINIQTPGVHHVALRVADFDRSARFYTETLGFPVVLAQPGLLIFLAGSTAFGIQGPTEGTPVGDVFNPFRVGLDHVAIALSLIHISEPTRLRLKSRMPSSA